MQCGELQGGGEVGLKLPRGGNGGVSKPAKTVEQENPRRRRRSKTQNKKKHQKGRKKILLTRCFGRKHENRVRKKKTPPVWPNLGGSEKNIFTSNHVKGPGRRTEKMIWQNPGVDRTVPQGVKTKPGTNNRNVMMERVVATNKWSKLVAEMGEEGEKVQHLNQSLG